MTKSERNPKSEAQIALPDSALFRHSSFVIRHSFRLAFPGLLSLVGCSVGPNYHRPSALGTNAIPSAYSVAVSPTNSTEWKPATPCAQLSRGPWWDVFNEPELDRLENRARVNNQEL